MAEDLVWMNQWLDQVAAGSARMSQRRLSSIDKHGGLGALATIAKGKGVHLLLLKDDKGVELVAASTEPFQTIC